LGQFSFVISKRREAFLDYLLANRVTTYKQIWRDLFPGLSKSIVSRHLCKLSREEKISRFFAQGTDGKCIQVFQLGPAAFELYSHHPEVDPRVNIPRSGKIKHDLHLGDIRGTLIRCQQVQRYYTESELICLTECLEDARLDGIRRLRSDAALLLNLNDKKYFTPLEFELNHKSKSRYLEKMKDYYVEKEVTQVLYVSATKGIQAAVCEAEKQVLPPGAMPKFFFAYLKSVMSADQEIIFTNFHGQNLVLQKPLCTATLPVNRGVNRP